jgi:hypothetical protein
MEIESSDVYIINTQSGVMQCIIKFNGTAYDDRDWVHVITIDDRFNTVKKTDGVIVDDDVFWHIFCSGSESRISKRMLKKPEHQDYSGFIKLLFSLKVK